MGHKGAAGDLFTGVHFNIYTAPSEFCFDVLCSDQPINDDENSQSYNVEAKVITMSIGSSLL